MTASLVCRGSATKSAPVARPTRSTSIGRNDFPFRCMNSRAAIVSTSLRASAPPPEPFSESTLRIEFLMYSRSSFTTLYGSGPSGAGASRAITGVSYSEATAATTGARGESERGAGTRGAEAAQPEAPGRSSESSIGKAVRLLEGRRPRCWSSIGEFAENFSHLYELPRIHAGLALVLQIGSKWRRSPVLRIARDVLQPVA